MYACVPAFASTYRYKSRHASSDGVSLSHVPCFHDACQADEEILLLEAIDMFGPGGWVSVAEHVGNKTPDQCKQHWFGTYIHVDSFPYPTPAPELAYLTEEELRAGSVQSHLGGPIPPRKRQREDVGTLAPSSSFACLIKEEDEGDMQ